MDKNITGILWLFAAICFLIVGVVNKNPVFIILGCAYICISFSRKNEASNEENSEK